MVHYFIYLWNYSRPSSWCNPSVNDLWRLIISFSVILLPLTMLHLLRILVIGEVLHMTKQKNWPFNLSNWLGPFPWGPLNPCWGVENAENLNGHKLVFKICTITKKIVAAYFNREANFKSWDFSFPWETCSFIRLCHSDIHLQPPLTCSEATFNLLSLGSNNFLVPFDVFEFVCWYNEVLVCEMIPILQKRWYCYLCKWWQVINYFHWLQHSHFFLLLHGGSLLIIIIIYENFTRLLKGYAVYNNFNGLTPDFVHLNGQEIWFLIIAGIPLLNIQVILSSLHPLGDYFSQYLIRSINLGVCVLTKCRLR